MKKVVKFGGSSLANSDQFRKVGEIIRSEESRRYVVPSAPGKRFPEDTKVTELLSAGYNKAAAAEAFSRQLKEISDRYYETSRARSLSLCLAEESQQLKKDLK